MKPFVVSAVLFAGSLAVAADEPAAVPETKETVRSLMLEDAKRKAADAAKSPGAATPTKPSKDSKLAAPAPSEAPLPSSSEKAAAKSADNATANTAAAAQPVAVLPTVEVKKARITVLDVQLAEQQREIAREQKLTKPTELDKALNDSKVAKALSGLGGQSADYRAGLAKERVSMMQEESDLIEAIAHAKTKPERAALQKELDELRAYRRELEQARR